MKNESWMRYITLPRTSRRPERVDKILEERLRRHRSARELRLTALEKL